MIVVVGEVMLDVVAFHDAPLAVAQRHARADLAAARRRGRQHRRLARPSAGPRWR